MRALLLMLLAATPALADEANTLRSCRALPEAAARLACYDALPLPADNAKPAAAGGLFGFARRPAAEPEAQAVESRIDGSFDGWQPRSQIKLANGQVWQIDDGSTGVFSASNPKVKISKGLLGGLFLEIEGLNHAPRVKRLQ
ncbi:MAG TPA: hypothetical protein VJN44_17230 [Roseateles sp.]|nr:hypothetical protein [Roseateles sp.]